MEAKKKQRSSLYPLPSEVRATVRSGLAVGSMAQCVEELVYNAIDAGANVIQIGVNLDRFNLRVDDDGDGITEIDLELVGIRYNTSKCNSLVDLRTLAFYGFRGEALASIVDVSNTVDIITRPKAMPGVELKKKFVNGSVQGFVEKHNSQITTSGTTVIVGRLLSRLPVRQQLMDKSIQLEEIKTTLENISLINPSKNIELRNEVNGAKVFAFQTSTCYDDAINQIFRSRIGFEVKFVEEHFLHKKYFFNLSVSNDFVKKKNYQFVFLNNRFIRRCKIHRLVGTYLLDRRKDSEGQNADKFPIFILNISCPPTEFDITLEPKKQAVQFSDWEAVVNGIEGLITKLKHKNSFIYSARHHERIDKNSSHISSRDVKSALHSRIITRDNDKTSSVGSDSGSIGKFSGPKPIASTSRNNRNLTRSSHTTHVVDVREIRRKRKLENATVAKPQPSPKRRMSNAVDADNKPNLTLGAFKRFPEWKSQFQKPNPVIAKQSKETHPPNQESYRYYVPDTYPHEKHNSMAVVNQPSGFDWKMSKFLETYQPGAPESLLGERVPSVIDTPISILRPSSNASSSNHDHIENETTENSNKISAFRYVSIWSEEILYTHFNSKVKVKDLREDILRRLFKYHRTIPKVRLSSSKKSTKKFSPEIVNVEPKNCNAPTNSTLKPENVEPSEPKVPVLKTPVNSDVEISVINVYETGAFSLSKSQNSLTKGQNTQKQSTSTVGEDKIVPSFLNVTPDSKPDDSKQSDMQFSFASNVLQTTNMLNETTMTENSVPGSFVKPARLDYFQNSFGAPVLNNSSCAPPLLNLFPLQKSFSSEWDDQMMFKDSAESEDEFFSEWGAEIVSDSQGQEWLQTLDSNGRNVYINLSTGDSTYELDHRFGSVRKISAREMQRSNPTRFNWLRQHFPRGFKQFWNGNGREITKDGDLTKLTNSVIGESLLKCINQQKPSEQLSKWTDTELLNVSKYFSDNKESAIKTVNNIGSSSGIQSWKDLGGATKSVKLNREDFELVRVIGQYDKKFILAAIRKSHMDNETLVIFDQHAVDERIRLERFITDSFVNPKSAIKHLKPAGVHPPYSLPLSETEVRIIQSYGDLFRQAALGFDIITPTLVKVKTVPKCFLEKCINEPTVTREETFRNLVQSLVQELIYTIMDTKVATLSALPKVVHNVLCSQACHGAFKFGDALDLDTCKQLILQLRECKNLFQCAHGRPSVVPLLKGQDLQKVAAAGQKSYQDRKPIVVKENSSNPLHEECCSKYFGGGKSETETTSSYFSSVENSANNVEAQENPACGNVEEETTSSYFNFFSVEKSNTKTEVEESPYFLFTQPF